MKRTIVMLLAAVGFCTAIYAQNKVKQPDTYNYQSGVEAYSAGDYETSLDFFEKELESNPKNGYAYIWEAYIHYDSNQLGLAMTKAQKGVKLLPKKETEFLGYAYELMGDTQLALGDTLKALGHYESAFKATQSTDYLLKRCQTFHEMERYDDEAADIKRALAIDENSAEIWVYAGRLEVSLGNYDKAIENHNYAMKLDADYVDPYIFRADAYMGQKKYREAVQDMIEALDRGGSAFYQLSNAADSAYVIVSSQLKAKQLKKPEESRWTAMLGFIQLNRFDFPAAEKSFRDALKIAQYEGDDTSLLDYELARVLNVQGKQRESLEYINKCLEVDSTYYDCWQLASQCYYELYDYDKALECVSKAIELSPEDVDLYTSRARSYRDLCRYDDAIADLELAMALEPESVHPLLGYAKIYAKQGETEKKNEWVQKANDLIMSLPEDERPMLDLVYVNAYLGNAQFVDEHYEEALKDVPKSYLCYEKACLYSLLDRKDEALDAMKDAFENGYCDYNLIENDVDLLNIADTERFKSLLEEYKQNAHPDAADEADGAEYEDVVTEVPFTKEAGIYKVKCNINELPLNFYFDTGAADVTISNVEALFMLKNDYLKASDLKGTTYYGDANGDISEGTIILLKKVEFGGLTLDNVKASVVHNQKAPLLLGQTVLSRLGKIEIDYEKSVLKITSKKRVK